MIYCCGRTAIAFGRGGNRRLLSSAPAAVSSSSYSDVLASIRGTVLELMARGVPQRDRQFLADRWGFSCDEATAASTAPVGKMK